MALTSREMAKCSCLGSQPNKDFFYYCCFFFLSLFIDAIWSEIRASSVLTQPQTKRFLGLVRGIMGTVFLKANW